MRIDLNFHQLIQPLKFGVLELEALSSAFKVLLHIKCGILMLARIGNDA